MRLKVKGDVHIISVGRISGGALTVVSKSSKKPHHFSTT